MSKNKMFILLFSLPYIVVLLFLGFNYSIYGISNEFLDKIHILSLIVPLSILPIIIYVISFSIKSRKKFEISNGRFVDGKLISLKSTGVRINRIPVYNIEVSLYDIEGDTLKKDVKIPFYIIHKFNINDTYKIHQSHDNPNIFNFYLDEKMYF